MFLDTCRGTTVGVLVRDKKTSGSKCNECMFNLIFIFACDLRMG